MEPLQFLRANIMARYKRANIKTLVQQQLRLKQTYPELIDKIWIRNNKLTCIMRLQPTPQSIEYKVKVWFKPGYWPQSSLLEPHVFAKYNGEKPHHLYDRSQDGKERLCVFSPRDNEWNDGLFLADNYIPWVITWLSAYEIWQITGIWVYPEQKDGLPKKQTMKE